MSALRGRGRCNRELADSLHAIAQFLEVDGLDRDAAERRVRIGRTIVLKRETISRPVRKSVCCGARPTKRTEGSV